MSNRRTTLVMLPIIVVLMAHLLETASTPMPSLGREQNKELNIGATPLPNGAIELRRELRFPEDKKEGPYLAQPEGFVLAPSDQIYIADVLNNEIYVFDPFGKHILTFGRTGQGPGEFIKPASIASSPDSIIVREAGNMRVQFFDLLGKYQKGFRIFRDYTSIVLNNESFYAAPLLYNRKSNTRDATLIDQMNMNGQVLRSFGIPLDVANPWLNQVILSIGSRNELWVAFKFFPIVRKYALDGKLLGEYRYRYEIAERKEAFNIDSIKSHADRFTFVIEAAFASDNGLYLVDSLADHRILVFFMNDNGQISEFYWTQIERKGFTCNGVIVRESRGQKAYYILNGSEACVDVFSPIR